MKKSHKKVLPFPKPPEEPGASTIVCQIGDERFAIRWEIEELPPVAPLLARREGSKEARAKIVVCSGYPRQRDHK